MRQTVQLDDMYYHVLGTKEGGMGVVWILERCDDQPRELNPVYRYHLAVKTFKEFDDQGLVEAELSNWISLQHPNVVPLVKIGRLDYQVAAIMPKMAGSLADELQQRGTYSEADTAGILLHVVEGLNAAYRQARLLHLDLKPSNILFDYGTPRVFKVADWGISRLVSQHLAVGARPQATAAGANTLTAYAAGTYTYMAPERFSGGWKLHVSADVFSLGLIALQLRTGTLPFRYIQTGPVQELISGAYAGNAAKLLQSASAPFRTLCTSCIDYNPSRRPQSFDEVRALLKKIR